ncbi:hypothetical protein G8759_10060 [Spirosoma aureum]|uniref:Biopolymer transporter ExbD n=1 Tax=Spirosoma aureum TaxID=2692134 RepID=A0A6G9AKE5_9BACT|nr:biopolymer transporter ExbD [Spirosoma aureum]QIP12942.1 hypothetical protein G8759_10060 [Spirosoma aureum]
MITRRSYIPVRIDFTPFVSIALLLIVFFVFQKAIQRPVIMGVTVPSGCHNYESPVYPQKVVTLFLLDKDRIGFMQYWHGNDKSELQQTGYGPEGLNKLLETVKNSANGDVAVVIKPTSFATFGNVANTLKALKLVGNLPYLLLSDLTSDDQLMIQHYERLFIRYPSSFFREPVYLKKPAYFSSQPNS